MKPDNELPWKHHQMSPRIPRDTDTPVIEKAILFLCVVGLSIYLVWPK